MKPAKRIKKAPSNNNYVDNVKFYEAMKVYIYKCREAKEAGMERPVPNNYIGKCIMDIATNLARSHKFSRYIQKDEMIEDGIENCITYIDRFDPDKYRNPHAYFTQIVFFAFLRRIELEKKILYNKYKQIEQFNFESQLSGAVEQITYSDGAYENMEKYMRDYEEKQEKKKLEKELNGKENQ
jgi:hypothetical protein